MLWGWGLSQSRFWHPEKERGSDLDKGIWNIVPAFFKSKELLKSTCRAPSGLWNRPRMPQSHAGLNSQPPLLVLKAISDGCLYRYISFNQSKGSGTEGILSPVMFTLGPCRPSELTGVTMWRWSLRLSSRKNWILFPFAHSSPVNTRVP